MSTPLIPALGRCGRKISNLRPVLAIHRDPVSKNQKIRIKSIINKSRMLSQTPVAHACNPSYSEGRDQED
jgi:aspartyl aminopeptidase